MRLTNRHVLLLREAASAPPNKRDRVDSAEAVFRRLGPALRYLPSEHFYLLTLDVKNGLLGQHLITVGTATGTMMHPREVFRPALLDNAAGIIMVHNHPSGDPAPSPEDIEVTRQLKEASELIGITLIDHIVIGDGTYCSLAELGVI